MVGEGTGGVAVVRPLFCSAGCREIGAGAGLTKGARALITSTMGNHSEFSQMLDDVNNFRLRPPVDRVFPLGEGAQAFVHLEAGEQFGKVVLSAD